MDATTKFLLGGILSAALGWFIYDTSCTAAQGASIATTSVTPVPAAAVPAAAAPFVAAPEAVAAANSCQSDINTLMSGKTINFQSGSAYLANDSIALIGDIAKALAPCNGVNVEVQGHTDLRGDAAINQTLSQSRADTVMNALVGKGVAAAQLSAKGYGQTQPLENARTKEADAKNRRTAFVITAAAPAPVGGQ